LFVQYTNPAGYPPLEHSSRILADAGWQVLFLGTGSLGANVLCFPPHKRIEVRQLPFSPAGWQQKLHYLRFGFSALWWTLRWQPAWVYASDLLSCPVALLLSLLPGVRVIYHEHDSPASSNGSLFRNMSLAARRRLARRAKICVLPNKRRAERFDGEVNRSSNNGHQSTFIVWNCPSLEEISTPRQAYDGGDLWVLYHGSIVPSRLPKTVFHAMTRLPSRVKLRVIGYETIGRLGYVKELQALAEQLGINRRVEFIEAVPRKQLLEWCRKCDIGLALMPRESEDCNMQAMVGASNKPFDYLSCGLALLVSDLPDWRQMYVDTSYGLACDPEDPESIAAALNWFASHPDEMRSMGERGQQRIAMKWNYEEQFSPVFKQMIA
jgi:glycosyltransferase involved in cell wall biosynthesis